jgi:NitT/TauT family transport system substrate-binding protein
MRVKEPLLAAIAWAATTAGVAAEDVKVSVTQRGLWDIAVSKPGQRSGIMQSHGLKLEILYTSGGAKSQQALVAGSVEIACGGGIEWAIGAYAKGAPLRIIGSEMIGSPDTYWYGVADSPIRSIRDAAGKAHQLVSDFETAQGANTGRSRCIGGL